MVRNYSIIGGDLRIVKLYRMLKNEGNSVKTYALDNSEEVNKSDKYETLEDALKNSEIIISALPFSKDGYYINAPYSDKKIMVEELFSKADSQKIFAGLIKEEILCEHKNLKIYDLMKDESLTIMNAVSTVEGAIQIAMEETKKTIHNSKILILGFGRIGKILAKNLKALGAEVTCEARKSSDIAWIKAYNYNPLELEKLDQNIEDYEIIFNTVPSLILDRNLIKKIKKDSLIIDLASAPGGVNIDECNNSGIKCIWARGLPGKVAPVTSAENIKNVIYRIIEKE